MTEKEKLEEAKMLYKTANADQRYVLESLFPELRESDDERIRKWLIGYFRQYKEDGIEKYANGLKVESIIVWLEKQGKQKPYGQRQECVDCQFNYAGECKGYCTMKKDEQKSADKVEPKFKVGDWVIWKNNTYLITANKYRYVTIDQKGYETNFEFGTLDEEGRLWDIKDAKDGDVLYLQHDGKEHIIIYKGVIKERLRTFISAYCAYNGIVDAFCFADVSRYADIAYGGIMPATKEQHDLLFAKMKEACYEWDAKNKEVMKLEQNNTYVINNTLNCGISVHNEELESEDERIREAQLNYWRSVGGKEWYGVPVQETIAWLEKQGNTNETINRTKFAQGVLKGAAINLITWIDYNAAEGNICLSNRECKDIEDALVSGDWDKIYGYMKKKLEKQEEHKKDFRERYDKISDSEWFKRTHKDMSVEINDEPKGKTVLETINEEKGDNTNKVEPEFKLEQGKWYRCILTPVVHKHFTVGKVYRCELEGCLVDDINEDRIVDLDLECFRPATEDEIPQEKSEGKVAIADLETQQDPILIRPDRIYDLMLEIRNNTMLRAPYIETYPRPAYPIEPWYGTETALTCGTQASTETINTKDNEEPETNMP